MDQSGQALQLGDTGLEEQGIRISLRVTKLDQLAREQVFSIAQMGVNAFVWLDDITWPLDL